MLLAIFFEKYIVNIRRLEPRLRKMISSSTLTYLNIIRSNKGNKQQLVATDIDIKGRL